MSSPSLPILNVHIFDHEIGAKPLSYFSGKVKNRVQINEMGDNSQFFIALSSKLIQQKEPPKLGIVDRLLGRVILHVKDDVKGEGYIKVDGASLRKRFEIDPKNKTFEQALKKDGDVTHIVKDKEKVILKNNWDKFAGNPFTEEKIDKNTFELCKKYAEGNFDEIFALTMFIKSKSEDFKTASIDRELELLKLYNSAKKIKPNELPESVTPNKVVIIADEAIRSEITNALQTSDNHSAEWVKEAIAFSHQDEYFKGTTETPNYSALKNLVKLYQIRNSK